MPELPTPRSLSGPLVWSEQSLRNKDEELYKLKLTSNEISDINTSLEHFKALELDLDQVSPATFPLGGLARQLQNVAQSVHGGLGFTVIQGLDMAQYSIKDSVIIFLGIASHIADKRGYQDTKGNILAHITNSKLWNVPMEKRHGIHSNKALTLLAPNWPVQISGHHSRYYLAPALAMHGGKLMTSLDPNRFGRHAASTHADIPDLTTGQRHALERLFDVAMQAEVRLKLETGSFLFLNNWAILHRRDAYEDDESTSRHMVRLWLRNSQLGWAIPTRMLPPWLAAYGDGLQRASPIYALHPLTTYIAPKYSAGSAAFVMEDSDESDGE
ncbi:hypothetical protein RJ55_04656 [Drechmeria coniospora]|nr:hypothetical protein RJ55_04656 [Drechmeria coniospora]